MCALTPSSFRDITSMDGMIRSVPIPELLFVPNHSRCEVFAILIRAFDGNGHGLTALRNDRPAYGLVRSAGPFALVGERVGIYLPYRNPVIKYAVAGNDVLCTVIYHRITSVDPRAASPRPDCGHLYPTIKGFSNRGKALDRKWCRRVL